jgi:predicted alpha/beta hydrolase family esterase
MKKQQVVIIHGGEAFNSYKGYLDFLRKEKITKDDFKAPPEKKWRHWMSGALGEDYEVFAPQMPGGWNCKYKEWKIWLEKIMKFLDREAIFVGHSLGGITLAKYFAKEGDKKNAKAVFLIAAPFNSSSSKDQIADFVLPSNLTKLRKMGSKVKIFHSEDDSVVRYTSFKKYIKALPEAEKFSFTDKDHFIQPEFPELVEEIRSLE